MPSRRLFHHRMHRFATAFVAMVFLLQAFAAASMPLVVISADEDVIVICTGSGMKTMSLSELGINLDQDLPSTYTQLPGSMCALCLFAHGVAILSPPAFTPATDIIAHGPQAPPAAEPILSGFRRVQQARAPPSSI
uniref:DUF2946 family protein n=2 Tax=Alcaligenes faecalis TaxID=511 RepID=UPI003D05FC93